MVITGLAYLVKKTKNIEKKNLLLETVISGIFGYL